MNKRTQINQTLDKTNRKLAKEWHPTRNTLLSPMDVKPCSNKKVWWFCSKGHEWEAKISERSSGSGCPYCTGKKINEENCLQTVNLRLAKQWHPTKNVPLTPRDVTSCSGKKAWWVCKRGHEWEAAIYSRNKGVGCPYCAGKKVNEENCLQTVNRRLARQWHPLMNAPLTPRDVTSGSDKEVWWLCVKNHKWKARVYQRNKGIGCPYCVGKKVNKENCLQTVNPRLARQWHPIKNAPLTPRDVTSCSGKKAWWVCKRGHEWQTNVLHRSYGTGCPYCSGNKASRENCLETVSPRVTREWHPIKNAPLTPRDVTRLSRREIWWRCDKGHEWQETVINRFKGFGCPVCILREKYPQKANFIHPIVRKIK